MSISRQEEIIAALWVIASLLAFNNEFEMIGYALAIKAAADCVASIYLGIKELKDNP